MTALQKFMEAEWSTQTVFPPQPLIFRSVLSRPLFRLWHCSTGWCSPAVAPPLYKVYFIVHLPSGIVPIACSCPPGFESTICAQHRQREQKQRRERERRRAKVAITRNASMYQEGNHWMLSTRFSVIHTWHTCWAKIYADALSVTFHDLICRALNSCPLKMVKVVILGQGD
jgi:hypothetical protein